MSESAQALSLGSHGSRENFAKVHPDDGALGKGEKRDVTNEEPKETALMLATKENCGYSSEACRSPDRADQKQSLTPDLINHRHG